jgi:hypothetical protein
MTDDRLAQIRELHAEFTGDNADGDFIGNGTKWALLDAIAYLLACVDAAEAERDRLMAGLGYKSGHGTSEDPYIFDAATAPDTEGEA